MSAETTWFSGEKLYGDDFSAEEIESWFKDESEGYADLGAREKGSYSYGYHQLNNYHAFRFLRGRRFEHTLGIGSAYGEEFKPIVKAINKIKILDPSNAFCNVKEIFGTPCEYFKPNFSGHIPFENQSFDLVASLGVMHHIPNVSYVMQECYRCLNDGGIMILREPIVSMGDWRFPRRGLTKRERGIPLAVMDDIIDKAGFKIKHKTLCCFPVVPILASKLGVSAYNNAFLTLIDALFSKLFSWNLKYHRTKWYEKLGPASVYYVLEK